MAKAMTMTQAVYMVQVGALIGCDATRLPAAKEDLAAQLPPKSLRKFTVSDLIDVVAVLRGGRYDLVDRDQAFAAARAWDDANR